MSAAERAAIRRLRSGIVPNWQLARLSVSCDEIHRLAERALTSLLDGERVFPTFVTGEWGTGKSHLLAYVRTLAASTGIATATVDLNARSAALNYPQRLLPVVARTLRVGDQVGIREVLFHLISDPSTRKLLLGFVVSGEAGEIGWALGSLLDAVREDNSMSTLDHPAWRTLSGADLSWSDHISKREKAVARLEKLAGMFRAVGMGGLVLVLDEAETIDQLWNIRSRVVAYGVLGRLLRCPAMWCVLGTTARFDRAVGADVAAEMGTDSSRFVSIWRRREEGSAVPPVITDKVARLLAEKVCALYTDAYGDVDEVDALVSECVAEWRRNPIRNPRRLLRSVVSALDRRRPLVGPSKSARSLAFQGTDSR